MSLQFRIADQVLQVNDGRDTTYAVVHKYDAFLNLLCAERYSFQRDAVCETLRFLVSDKYPDLERLARENWKAREAIRQRHESLGAYLSKMLLRDRKSISLDLATGTGKSFVMYVLAAIALAEGLAERVLVLCPSLPIEDGLLEKFTARAGNGELSGIMQELGAAVSSERRGAPLVQPSRSGLEGVDEVFPAH
jgi:type III restriction enzyme